MKVFLKNGFALKTHYRRLSRLVIESFIWILSSFIAAIFILGSSLDSKVVLLILFIGLYSAFIFILVNFALSVYRINCKIASFEELVRISTSVVITTIITTLIGFLLSVALIPLYTPILTGIISMQLQNWLRIIVSKKVFSYLLKHRVGSRTLIYGAGITGQQLVEQMVLNSQFYNPIGFLDDDMSKSNFVYMRISVIGNINDLQKVVKENQVKFLIVAISKIQASKLVHLEQKCKEIGVSMRVIPSPLEILKTNLNLEDILNFSAEDILGRPQIEYNKKEIFDFLQGKRVLITGAGGSIGSELARQINQVNTEELLLLDRDETALLNLNLSLKNDGLFKDDNIILGDIRDSKMISDLIEKRKPEIVFHVAALKHLALVEKYPEEAHKTNVIATQNLIKACLDFNVRYFVNISSDKAVDPINVLGKTKLDIERVIATISSPDKIYISVRFGNVIGSNGSFLNTFGQQIKNGGPITITHPEVTRYFMSVSDAVFLVLQSLLVGKCGETLILDMGDPIKIDDIAKKMVSDSGKNIDIIYTGLRIGEKLHEKLIGEHEVVNLTKNPYIKSTNVVNEAEA